MLLGKESSQIANKKVCFYSIYAANTFPPRGGNLFWQYQIVPLIPLQSLTFTPVPSLSPEWKREAGYPFNLKCYSQVRFSGPPGLISATLITLIEKLVLLNTNAKQDRINIQEWKSSTDRHSTSPFGVMTLTLTSQINEQNWKQAYLEAGKAEGWRWTWGQDDIVLNIHY